MQALHALVADMLQILRDPVWGSLGVIVSVALLFLPKKGQKRSQIPFSQKIC